MATSRTAVTIATKERSRPPVSGLPTAAKLLSFGQAFAALSNLEPFLGQLAISLLFGNFGEL